MEIPEQYQITSLIHQNTYLVSGELKPWKGETSEVYSTISSTKEYKPTLLGTIPTLGKNVAITLEQRAVVQRRCVAVAVTLECSGVAVRGDDRVDFDDAAHAGQRRVAAANAINRRPARVRDLATMVKRRRDAVVDPL